MNLKEALAFTESKVAEGFRSDGCTFAPDLGIMKFCEMHDALRQLAPVTAFEADNLFFKGICTKGARYWPVACIYWLFVRAQSVLGTGGTVSAVILLSFLTIAYFAS